MNEENIEELKVSSENKSEKNPDNIQKASKVKKIRKTSNRKLFLYLIIGEAVVLAICLIISAAITANSTPMDIPMDRWFSDYTTYTEDGWYADPINIDKEEEVDFIYGPYLEMKSGSYLITVDYTATEDQVCYAAGSRGSEYFIKHGTSTLSKKLNTISFRADVTHTVYNFEVIVRYNGNGTLRINSITIQEDGAAFSRLFVYLLLLFIICDIWFLFSDKLRKNKNLILFILGIAFLCSLPLFADGIGRGHDLQFHVMRIDALADSLKHGVFLNRISSLWYDGYGYPTSIYYGDLLLYFPALLRVAGFTVVAAYKAYIVFINLATAIIGYLCFNGMFKDRKAAALASLVYSTATYRLINIFIRSAVGEYTAMLFFPVVAFAVHKIYTTDKKDKSGYRKAAFYLALGMTGLITCHILSTEMVAFLIIAVCFVMLKETLRPAVIKTYLLAIAETVLMSAFFLIPFIDYYINVSVRVNNSVDSSPFIQHHGCTIGEFFAVFRDIFSSYTVHYHDRLASTPGLVLMLTLMIAIAVFANMKKSSLKAQVLFYTVFSVFSLYLASNLFPWDIFAQSLSIGRLLAQVQFPWRYVAIAILFLTLLFTLLIKMLNEKDFGSHSKYIKGTAFLSAVFICVVSSFIFTGNYLDDIRYRTWYDTADLDTGYVSAGEYLLLDFNIDNVDGKINSTYMETIELLERNGCKMELYCESSGKDGTVEVPIFNYKGYVVKDDKGNTYDISDGENNVVKFTLPKNFKGNITIDFVEPWYWRVSEIVTLLTIIGLFVLKKYPQLNAPKMKTKK